MVWLEPVLWVLGFVDGYLGSLHFLAITNDVAMNMRMQGFYELIFSLILDLPQVTKLVGHRGACCLTA